MTIDFYQNLEGDDLLRQVGRDINALGQHLMDIKTAMGRIEHRLPDPDILMAIIEETGKGEK